jgi:hypothetical protein
VELYLPSLLCLKDMVPILEQGQLSSLLELLFILKTFVYICLLFPEARRVDMLNYIYSKRKACYYSTSFL